MQATTDVTIGFLALLDFAQKSHQKPGPGENGWASPSSPQTLITSPSPYGVRALEEEPHLPSFVGKTKGCNARFCIGINASAWGKSSGLSPTGSEPSPHTLGIHGHRLQGRGAQRWQHRPLSLTSPIDRPQGGQVTTCKAPAFPGLCRV